MKRLTNTEDEIFMENAQKEIDKAKFVINTMVKTINGLHIENTSEFLTDGFKLNNENMNAQMFNLYLQTINDILYKIISHFKNTYKVKLESKDFIKMDKYGNYPNDMKRYEDVIKWYKNIDCKIIIDIIESKLGTLEFKDNAYEELKKDFKNFARVYSQRTENIVIKKNKLTLKEVSLISKDGIFNDYRISHYNSENAKTFVNALNCFDNKGGTIERTELNDLLLNEYDYPKREIEDILGKKIELKMTSLKNVKFFKNGRIDIEFKTVEDLEIFRREFLSK